MQRTQLYIPTSRTKLRLQVSEDTITNQKYFDTKRSFQTLAPIRLFIRGGGGGGGGDVESHIGPAYHYLTVRGGEAPRKIFFGPTPMNCSGAT